MRSSSAQRPIVRKMNNPSIPIKLVMARVIARKALDQNLVKVTAREDLEFFLSEQWDSNWSLSGYHDWEISIFWKDLEYLLPEILEKLAENEQERGRQ